MKRISENASEGSDGTARGLGNEWGTPSCLLPQWLNDLKLFDLLVFPLKKTINPKLKFFTIGKLTK